MSLLKGEHFAFGEAKNSVFISRGHGVRRKRQTIDSVPWLLMRRDPAMGARPQDILDWTGHGTVNLEVFCAVISLPFYEFRFTCYYQQKTPRSCLCTLTPPLLHRGSMAGEELQVGEELQAVGWILSLAWWRINSNPLPLHALPSSHVCFQSTFCNLNILSVMIVCKLHDTVQHHHCLYILPCLLFIPRSQHTLHDLKVSSDQGPTLWAPSRSRSNYPCGLQAALTFMLRTLLLSCFLKPYQLHMPSPDFTPFLTSHRAPRLWGLHPLPNWESWQFLLYSWSLVLLTIPFPNISLHCWA